jgi:threonine synthase
VSAREGSQRGRGARRAVHPALAPGGLSEERAQSALTHLECSACGTRYDCERPQNLCRCGHPPLARYDLTAVTATPAEIAARPRGLWRWAELLPVRDPAHRVTLGEGDTPLLPLAHHDWAGVLIKDEGLNPTGSFKARGAAVGASRAGELGARHVALPTATPARPGPRTGPGPG